MTVGMAVVVGVSVGRGVAVATMPLFSFVVRFTQMALTPSTILAPAAVII